MGLLRQSLAAIGAAAVVAALCASPAHAERRIALVIGNGAYQNATPLPNPRNDAEDVAAALKRVGFETILGLDLDKARFDDHAIRFARSARGADVAVFYYSGHAMQFGGVNYLMPVDARLSDEADLRRLSRVDDILADLQQARNLRILVLDSCRDNPLAENLKRSIGLTRAASLQRGLAKIDSPQGMIVAYATQSGRTADDGTDRNSPYTAAFLKRIEEREEIGTVFRRISADVYAATRQAQLPELSLSLIGEFYLRGRSIAAEPDSRATAAVPAPPADPDAAARADFDLARAVGTKEAWDAFLQKHRTGFLADLARTERNRVTALEVRPTPAPPPPSNLPSAPPAATAPRVAPPQINAASAPTLTWKLQNTLPAKTPTTLPLFAKRVEELSGGRMKVELLAAGSVVPAFQLADAVKGGVLDLGYGLSGNFYGKDRAFALMSAIPFGFEPRDQLAFRRRPDVSAIFDGLSAKHGIVALPCGSFGRNGDLWVKQPLTSAAGLKGVKLRFVAMAADIFREAGSSVTILPGSEVVPALERGIIDGTHFADPKSDLDLGLADTAKYYYFPGSVMPGYVLDLYIAKSKWDALPPAGRQIVEQACREATDAMLDDYYRLGKAALAEIARRGVTVAPLSAPVQRELYAASRRALTKLSGENDAVRAVMTIVEQMRSSTIADKLR
jgi:TRAP-type mannitol/chloroaromatic compound transport system substrate-binding protein